MKLNYIVIPLITFFVAFFGSLLTNNGIDWYKTIKLPSFTPPGFVIGNVWTVIFILSTVSVLIVWNSFPRDQTFWLIISLFLVNAVLNVFWSYLFFTLHSIDAAIFGASLLGISVFLLIFLIWPFSRLAGGLLIPYALWVVFATYLNYRIFVLNI